VDYQRLLLEHLSLIDRIVRTTGRRRHLSPPEVDDFSGFVRLRLIEDDHAILRKFKHRSSWWTYLSAVIERLSLDYCADKWGRWRPSASAERQGPAAVLLERLISRDHHSLPEAIEMIRTNHRIGLSEAELIAMWKQLPLRSRVTELGEEAAAALPSLEGSDQIVDDAERRRDVERLDAARSS